MGSGGQPVHDVVHALKQIPDALQHLRRERAPSNPIQPARRETTIPYLLGEVFSGRQVRARVHARMDASEREWVGARVGASVRVSIQACKSGAKA